VAKNKDKDEDLPAAQTQERLERLARLIRSAGHAKGLIPAQWDVLRYLSRANAFSNSPVATAHYMGATKGTVSQTILALVKKGLVESRTRSNDQRSISLHLTPKGHDILAQDPLAALFDDLNELGAKTRKRFAKAVDHMLAAQAQRQDQAPFGSCETCRFLLHSQPPACASFGTVLESEKLSQLCIRFKPVGS
jgi:DNA-binding MarR family transcriptional regulator